MNSKSTIFLIKFNKEILSKSTSKSKKCFLFNNNNNIISNNFNIKTILTL